MSNFTAKAILDAKGNNRELIEALEGIGYIHIADSPFEYLVIQNGEIDEVNEYTKSSIVSQGFIDSNHYANGDEELAVKLFISLSQCTEQYQITKILQDYAEAIR